MHVALSFRFCFTTLAPRSRSSCPTGHIYIHTCMHSSTYAFIHTYIPPGKCESHVTTCLLFDAHTFFSASPGPVRVTCYYVFTIRYAYAYTFFCVPRASAGHIILCVYYSNSTSLFCAHPSSASPGLVPHLSICPIVDNTCRQALAS